MEFFKDLWNLCRYNEKYGGKQLLRLIAETCNGFAMHKLRTFHAVPKKVTGNIANNAIRITDVAFR
jgi:hypothetical protein